MKVEIKDNKLLIEIDLDKPTPSSSGKSLVVASTHGNVVTTAVVNGKPVTIGLNAYVKPTNNAEVPEAERQEKIKQQEKTLGKEKQKLVFDFAQEEQNLFTVYSKISGYVAKIEEKKMNISDLKGKLSTIQNGIEIKSARVVLLEAEQTPSVLEENRPEIKKLKDDIQKDEERKKELANCIAAVNNSLEELETLCVYQILRCNP